jgi:hypothetical protein
MTTDISKATPQAEIVPVPIVPTKAMWSGLARDIVMWRDLASPTGQSLYQHLRRVGRDVPEWLATVIPDINHVPSKGNVAAAIWRAMIDAAPAVNAYGAGQGDAVAWQDISSAPKERRAILVWCADRKNTYVVTWGQIEDERWGWMHFCSGHPALSEEPTYWMPLPPPPGTALPPAASARIAELEAALRQARDLIEDVLFHAPSVRVLDTQHRVLVKIDAALAGGPE